MKQIRKVLLLGSGALKIGEAGEFDYSGSQAIKALKEEGIKVVLVNPNIATVQTSKFLADTVYFLPVDPYFVEQIIKKEKPDGIMLSFGGQTALNCGVELYKKGILKKHHVEILGSPISSVLLSEDRKSFANHLKKIGVPAPLSMAVKNVRDALRTAKQIGYPVMVRAGFALGGQGSGIVTNEKQLKELATRAFSFVKQILVEKYLHHYKEIEYEVVRDSADNCITVCNMENMDPLGIHTGESIVVAPSQTLTNFEYHKLREVSIKIVRSLGIVGECNVQFALNPKPQRSYRHAEPDSASQGIPKQVRDDNEHNVEFYVIELNARLSRSSALASKATGYPLAYVAAKLALGKKLTELTNKVTQVTQFCFEPALDYITVKIPRWDIDKFKNAQETIGSSMKSVGEVMAIGRTFEEAYQKAIRMLDLQFEGAVDDSFRTKNKQTITRILKNPTPQRMFAISQAFYNGMSAKEIYLLTGIDPWFLYRIKNVVEQEKSLEAQPGRLQAKLLELKQLGCSDNRIGQLVGKTGLEIRQLRKKMGIVPSVFSIDTLAGEFPAKTNYLYVTYNGNHHDVEPFGDKSVMVLGSGPYRIGSSVEFDWTNVNTTQNLKKHQKKSIVINCNPETVSTDYDISDRLYFEELTFERIADIYDFENPYGVIVSVGGQTPNNRAKSLDEYGTRILGTNPKNIDRAEDRSKFSALLDELKIDQPAWKKFTDFDSVLSFCEKVGFPILIRPSYVLSGTLMRVCHNKDDLSYFLSKASQVSKEYPITVSKFIEDAKEIELDAVAQQGIITAFVISEHVENAGVHSGDATIVLPSQTLSIIIQKKLHEVAEKLARTLEISGPFNIQFLVKDNTISVIEINLRASRTFPFISKVTGIDFVGAVVDALFDEKSSQQKYKQLDFIAVKVPQFSFARLLGADPILDVEMTSTGEVACFGENLEEAFLKGELAVGGKIPKIGIFISLGGEENKILFLESAKKLVKLNVPIYATEKTTAFLAKYSVKTKKLYKIYEHQSPNALEYFQKGKIDLAINLVEPQARKDESDKYTIRRAAIDHNVPLYTNLQKARLFVDAITTKKLEDLLIKSWDEYVN